MRRVLDDYPFDGLYNILAKEPEEKKSCGQTQAEEEYFSLPVYSKIMKV